MKRGVGKLQILHHCVKWMWDCIEKGKPLNYKYLTPKERSSQHYVSTKI